MDEIAAFHVRTVLRSVSKYAIIHLSEHKTFMQLYITYTV